MVSASYRQSPCVKPVFQSEREDHRRAGTFRRRKPRDQAPVPEEWLQVPPEPAVLP